MSEFINIDVKGKTWRFAKLSAAILRQFIEWAKSQLPNPYADLVAVIDKLPKEYTDELFKQAQHKAALRGSLNDPDLESLMKSTEGAAKLVQLRLKVYHPSITEDEALQWLSDGAGEHGLERWSELMRAADELGGKIPVSEEQAERQFFRL